MIRPGWFAQCEDQAFCHVRNGKVAQPGPGGGERTRTADFYVANVALCQLSYTPAGAPG